VRLADLIRARCRALAEDAAALDELARSADLEGALTPSEGCRIVLKLDRVGAALQAVTDLIGDAGPPPACAADRGPFRPRDGAAVG
jgi:hypothetical protein